MKAELAAEIGRARDEAAVAVTHTLLSRHPDWIEHYGDRAQTRGVQDAGHHIDFLQASVELDDPSTFRDYALWCRDLLQSHGISGVFLAENLETIRDELAVRLTPPATEAVRLAMSVALESLAVDEPSPWGDDNPLSPACLLYVAAAISGRREQALAIVRRALNDAESPVDVYVEVFENALYEVGRRWQTTGLTIAEEHMATATTQFILSVLQEELPRTRGHRGTAVVTGVVDENHVVGASIVANVLDADGWDVRFLGTNLPHDAILSAVEHHRATVLAISVTMSGCVARAHDLIALIRESRVDPPRIIVGGAAFRRDPHLWRTVGADGFAADAHDVAEIARG